METVDEPVIFEAHASSAVMRRVFWWLVPIIACSTAAAPLLVHQPIAGWAVLLLIIPLARFVMPRFMPLRVELEADAMRFGEGLHARRIEYDRVLVVDVRKADRKSDAEPDDPDDEPDDDSEDDAGEAEAGGADQAPAPSVDEAESTGTAEGAKAELWRVTVHAGLVPVSVSLVPDDATALAEALHAMCPRAALWDVDGELLEPIDSAAIDASISRVKRMAAVRRALSIFGVIFSLGAVGWSFGGNFIAALGPFGSVLPYFWMAIGAGLFGLALGADKHLRTRTTARTEDVPTEDP